MFRTFVTVTRVIFFVGVEDVLKLKPLNLATKLIFSLVDDAGNDVVVYFLATLDFFFVLNYPVLKYS